MSVNIQRLSYAFVIIDGFNQSTDSASSDHHGLSPGFDNSRPTPVVLCPKVQTQLPVKARVRSDQVHSSKRAGFRLIVTSHKLGPLTPELVEPKLYFVAGSFLCFFSIHCTSPMTLFGSFEVGYSILELPVAVAWNE